MQYLVRVFPSITDILIDDTSSDVITLHSEADKVYVLGKTVTKTILIGLTEEELKTANPALHIALKNAMITSNGVFSEHKEG